MFTRLLGRSKIHVSALGLGCWAIGGPFWSSAIPLGWSRVDDTESIRAIRRAVDLGVTFFDTADVYGCGHSEQVLGQALAGRRESVFIATKFGNMFDEESRHKHGYNTKPAFIRQAVEASLRRLNVDVIDLYQLHVKEVDPGRALEVRDTLEELVSAGKVRWYGWSTDDANSARLFAGGEHCAAIQVLFNVLQGSALTLRVCEENGLACIVRSPLAMGLLTGKFNAHTKFPDDDVRSGRLDFQGKQAELLEQFEMIRSILTQDGRTLAQGALGWLWARSECMIPIPGFKHVAQVEENVGALSCGPLSAEQMRKIDRILG